MLPTATATAPSVPTQRRDAEAAIATPNKTMVGSGGDMAVPPAPMKSCHTCRPAMGCVAPSGRCWLSEIAAPAQHRPSTPPASAISLRRDGSRIAGDSAGREVAATGLSFVFGNDVATVRTTARRRHLTCRPFLPADRWIANAAGYDFRPTRHGLRWDSRAAAVGLPCRHAEACLAGWDAAHRGPGPCGGAVRAGCP